MRAVAERRPLFCVKYKKFACAAEKAARRGDTDEVRLVQSSSTSEHQKSEEVSFLEDVNE